MALFQISLFSNCLRRSVPVNVLLPAEASGPDDVPAAGAQKLKTLYLLHGYMCNYTDWLCGASVSQLAQAYNLAVVMPSGDNSFYCDYAGSGINYGEYIGCELVGLTRRMFPLLSHAREDTLIGGLSMGGFGALRNGLKYNETFGHIIALSSAMILKNVAEATETPNALGISRSFYQSIFGDLDHLPESDNNPQWLARRLLETGPIPDLFFACGYNDRLVYPNRELRDYFREIGFPHVYVEGAGSHEWPFWDTFLKKGLEHALGALPAYTNPFWIDAGPEQA